MSSSYTATAFVVTGPWGEETRKNPATKFIETSAKEFFDSGDHSNMADFWTDEFSMMSPHATHHASGREDTHSNVIETFYLGPLEKFVHEPYLQVAIETQNGWDLHSNFYLFADVKGDPHSSEEKVKDSNGQEWDVKLPVHYRFELHNEPKAKYGMLIDHVTAIKDTGLVNSKLDQRGHGHRKSSVVFQGSSF